MATMVTPLTEKQHAVIETMIKNARAFDGEEVSQVQRQTWAEALDRLSYGKQCDCGQCPSFSIHADGQAIPESTNRNVLSAESPQAFLILFIDNNVPSYLEVAPSWETAITQLPAAEELTFS